MKKMKCLLVFMLFAGVLSGCSKDSTKKTTVCTGIVEGVEEKLTFVGEDNNLLSQTEDATIPLSAFGVTAEQYEADNSIMDLDFMEDNVMKETVGSTNMEGVDVKLTVEGENLHLKMKVDYTKVDLDALVDAGFVEAGKIATKYIGYDETVKSYQEKNDMTCKEK